MDELNATVKTLTDERQVSAVRIDEVHTGDPEGKSGYVPAEVKGVVAIHSAEESGPTGPVPFRFRFLLGLRAGKNGQPMLAADGKTPLPVVVGFEDATPKPGTEKP